MAAEDSSTQTRVCPRCGIPAEDQRFCSGCGLNILMQPELPSAEEHAARLREEEWLRAHPAARDTSTAEAVAVAPFAGWWQRAGASVVDAVVLVLPAVIIGYAFDATLAGLVILATVFAYFLLMIRAGQENGQTLGMQVMRIRVRRVDGAPVGVRTVAVRQLLMQQVLGLVTLYLYFIPDYLWPLWDKENRALHDMVAKTRVVRTDVS